MDVADNVKTALAAALAVPDMPEGFREIAFREVLRHLLSQPEQGTGATPATSAEQPGLVRLAGRTKVPVESLADLFEFEGDVVRVHAPSQRIDSVKARATREIALLVAAARQGSGLDESWTDVGHVRETLSSYGRYDQPNFSANLRSNEDVLNIRGKGSKTQIRLTQPGWEAATSMIRKLSGVDT